MTDYTVTEKDGKLYVDGSAFDDRLDAREWEAHAKHCENEAAQRRAIAAHVAARDARNTERVDAEKREQERLVELGREAREASSDAWDGGTGRVWLASVARYVESATVARLRREGWQEPRVIETVEELDALPSNTMAALEGNGLQRSPFGWHNVDKPWGYPKSSAELIAVGPVRVLYVPNTEVKPNVCMERNCSEFPDSSPEPVPAPRVFGTLQAAVDASN